MTKQMPGVRPSRGRSSRTAEQVTGSKAPVTAFGREHLQISQFLPITLLLVAALLLLVQVSETLAAGSLIATIVVFRVLYLQIMKVGHLRFTWLLSTGLLLGYGLGTLNTLVQMASEIPNASQIAHHDVTALCTALAVVLGVCAVMYLVGPALERPVEINWASVGTDDQVFLWTMFLTVGVAFATGSVGYRGISAEGRSNPLGIAAVLFIPVLPAFTVLLRKCKNSLVSRYFWIFLGVELLILLPQGRQVLIYSIVLLFLAMTVSGTRLRLSSYRTILLLAVSVATLYIGNKIFFAMRYERNQMGRKANISLLANLKDAAALSFSGDTRYTSLMQKNLRERTLVLGYFSDLLDASWTRQPLWGKTAIFNIRMSVPASLDRNKDEVLSMGAEENFVNPEFGLKPRDEANNILTTAVADFGVVGCFVYPLIFSIAVAAMFRLAGRRLPTGVKIIIFLILVYTLVHTEISTSAYLVACRNLVLVGLIFLAIDKISKTVRKQRRPVGMISRNHAGIKVASVFLLAFAIAPAAHSQGKLVSLTSVDPNCGHAKYNCRRAFQTAFKTLYDSHGGLLQLPGGTFTLEFPELPSNSRTAPQLSINSLIVVPPNTVVQGHRGADGTPDTVIEWSENAAPVFILANASGSAVKDIHFRFTGITPTNFPYGDVALLKALGFNPTFPHGNQMAGGNYEMFSVLYVLASEHCTFDNLVFDSATHDNGHVMGFVIDTKGKNVITAGGAGGIRDLAVGNSYNNIRLYDYIMGLMFSGQQDLKISNIQGDRRGSTMDFAPGHIIYVSAKTEFSPAGQLSMGLNKNVDIQNIKEGGDTYSNVHSGGTFALKYIDGGTVSHVVSSHPLGLGALNVDQNFTFKDMSWQSDYHLCENAPEVCQNSVMTSIASKPGEPALENITYENISLKSSYEPISFTVMGDHVIIRNLVIETPPMLKKGQNNTYAVLSVKDASDVAISGYHYIPVLKNLDPKLHYNAPFACWNPCKNVKGDVNTEWPSNVPVPRPDNPALRLVYQGQDQDPSKNIAITSKVIPGK